MGALTGCREGGQVRRCRGNTVEDEEVVERHGERIAFSPELLQLLSELEGDDELDELSAGASAGAGAGTMSSRSSAPSASGTPTRNSPPHSGSASPSTGGWYGRVALLDSQAAMLAGARRPVTA
eukprot:9469511-Pyramimonas_sp.AAC.2